MQRQPNELDNMATEHHVLSLASASIPGISNAQGVLKRADDSKEHFRATDGHHSMLFAALRFMGSPAPDWNSLDILGEQENIRP